MTEIENAVKESETDSRSNKINYGIIICVALLLTIIVYSHRRSSNK